MSSATGLHSPGMPLVWTGLCVLTVLLVLTSRGTHWRFVGWAALVFGVQALALGLTHAGTSLSYQHLVVPGWVAVLGLAFIGVVAIGLVGRAKSVRHELGTTGIIVGLSLVVLGSATLSPTLSAYTRELVAAAAIQLLGATCLVAAVRVAPVALLERLRRWRLLPGWRLPLLAGAACALLAAVLAATVYEAHPHVPDEVVYLLQAKYLAQGHWVLPPPPVPAAFDLHLMYLDSGRWFSPVPPGWPMVLALGARVGVPWLVNPLLAGLNVVLAWLVVREVYGEPVARRVALLLAASPWHLFLGMSMMTHQATLAAALGAAWGTAVARRTNRVGPAWWGGLSLGVVGLVRPLEGLVAALVLGVWSLGARGRRWRLAPSAWLTFGTVCSGLLVYPYNAMLTGAPGKFPIMMYTDRYYAPGANDLGFGANRGLGWGGFDPFPGHGPLDALINTNLNVFATNVELNGWVIGSVGVVAWLLLGARRRREDWWMVAVIAAVAGAHALYWYSGGPDFAARYWYLIVVPLLALVVRGTDAIAQWGHEHGDVWAAQRVSLAATVLTLGALALFLPWRARDKYFHFRGMRGDSPRVARAAGIGSNDLIFVQGNRHPDYMSAATYNPLDLREAQPIYVWDVSDSVRRATVAAFPARRVWVMEGPTVSGAGYRVTQGPLAPGTLPEGSFTPADVRAAKGGAQ